MNDYQNEPTYDTYGMTGTRDTASIQSEVVSKSFIFMFVALLLTGVMGSVDWRDCCRTGGECLHVKESGRTFCGIVYDL